ncbi:MAG TPA: aspartyl/asparaginyl beta-hydroxylase domain-containing protein [Casimicrobiaceae bacterium]|nr:aspartyl/asparaginyl beta-hydroxylase domain-containing protein [Casimicrobiaceae bacterium]
MPTPPVDARALALSGAEALRRGDPRRAHEAFAQIVAAGVADAEAFLGLAHACHGLKEHAAARSAVDQALALDPRNLTALILKADQLAAEGDDRAAASFYVAAIKAAPPPAQLPPDLSQALSRAQASCERYAAQFESYLRDRLTQQGVLDRASSARFVRSFDILIGKRKVYYQQPQFYYFPELPQIQFYEREAFPWLDRLEAATADIRDELVAALEAPEDFKPYVQADPRRPRYDPTGMLDNPAWSAFYLRREGRIVDANAARCPATMDALADVPLATVRNRSPSVLFSLLRPGARIPPHTGFVNTRLICHLPLIVPRDCALRVGNEIRVPVEGQAWVFDDTMEHEAWNLSDRIRAILLFEIWRPELSEEERAMVSAMFEAIDAHGGGKAAWTI